MNDSIANCLDAKFQVSVFIGLKNSKGSKNLENRSYDHDPYIDPAMRDVRLFHCVAKIFESVLAERCNCIASPLIP